MQEVTARHIPPGPSSTENSPGDGDSFGCIAGPSVCGTSGGRANFSSEPKSKFPMSSSAVEDWASFTLPLSFFELSGLSWSVSISIVIGIISFLLALLFLRVDFSALFPSTSFMTGEYKGVSARMDFDMSMADSRLFLGLPLALLAGVALIETGVSSCSSTTSGTVFLLAAFLGIGVPLLFTGASNDFRGLPLPFFSTSCGVSSPPFKGTVIVVERSTRRFVGVRFVKGLP